MRDERRPAKGHRRRRQYSTAKPRRWERGMEERREGKGREGKTGKRKKRRGRRGRSKQQEGKGKREG